MSDRKTEDLSKKMSCRKQAGSTAISLGHLQNSIGYSLRLASFFATQQFHKAMQPFQLRPAQFSTMVLIAANPGVTQRELCETLGIEKANFVGLLDILEDRKLVERREQAKDRRRYAIHLTQEGKALLDKAVNAHIALENRFRRRLLSGSRKEFVENLRQLW
jgi:DNA-binding MarR family transcriptional regulator